MKNLFVSYSHADKEKVLPVAEELQTYGFNVWFDTRGLIAGQLWEDKIVEAIMACDFFLLFISSNSVKSDNVRREVSLAFKNEKNIIPLRLEKVNIPPKWDYQIIGIQWIECEQADWKMRLSVALGWENSSPQPSLKNSSLQAIDDTETVNTNPQNKTLNQYEHLELMIELFSRDYVNPAECDETSLFLRNFADTLSLPPEQLYLEFSLRKKIWNIADQIDKFRKICKTGTKEADTERENILGKMDEVFQELSGK